MALQGATAAAALPAALEPQRGRSQALPVHYLALLMGRAMHGLAERVLSEKWRDPIALMGPGRGAAKYRACRGALSGDQLRRAPMPASLRSRCWGRPQVLAAPHGRRAPQRRATLLRWKGRRQRGRGSSSAAFSARYLLEAAATKPWRLQQPPLYNPLHLGGMSPRPPPSPSPRCR